uniref:CCHC-type domain-containing protein n=1 Tax=Chelonoidis abingdonii TaxID=106734 RepID=A0A8C0J699_CHEAB
IEVEPPGPALAFRWPRQSPRAPELLRFHERQYKEDKTPQSQLFDLIHLTWKWLRPEALSSEKMVEVLVLDQYMRGLPPGLQVWVGQNDTSTYDELVSLMERQLAARELFQTPGGVTRQSRKPTPNPRPRTVENYRRTVTGRKDTEEWLEAKKGPGGLGREVGGQPNSPRQRVTTRIRGWCYECGELGHIAAQCPNREEPMQSRPSTQLSFSTLEGRFGSRVGSHVPCVLPPHSATREFLERLHSLSCYSLFRASLL